MDFLPKVIGGSESEDEKEENVEVVKNDLNEEDVFDNKPVNNLEMKVVKEETPEEPVEEVVEEVVEEPKPVKKPRKKRVLTEAQKKKLAEARVKALEVRRANARKKQEIKDLKKQKQDQELSKLRNEVTPVKKIEKKPEPKKQENLVFETKLTNDYYSPINANGTTERKFSQEEVDMITFKAISNYDEIRKQRKKEKQKKKEEDSIKERERQKLLRIVNHNPQPYNPSTDPFANCY